MKPESAHKEQFNKSCFQLAEKLKANRFGIVLNGAYKAIAIRLNCSLCVLLMLILCSCRPHDSSLVDNYKNVASAVLSVFADVNVDDSNSVVFVGTGFFVDGSHVLTAAHVSDVLVEGTIELHLQNKSVIKAKKFKSDASCDLALLEVDCNDIKDFSVQKLRISRSVQDVGESIFIIGSPLKYEFTITSGILSNCLKPGEYELPFWHCDIYIVDGALLPGNSGSPVFNGRLEVIGVAVGRHFSLGVVIPSYLMREFLSENGISDAED